MKTKVNCLLLAASLALFGWAGCSKSESGGTTIDTAKVEAAFSTASAVDKAEVDKALGAIKSGDYAAAMASLNKAVANVKLTPEQQQSLKDLIAQVQAKVSNVASQTMDAAKKAGADASKNAADVQKAMTK